jgi:predicted alpha-1,6-mannanase (GH76 family)
MRGLASFLHTLSLALIGGIALGGCDSNASDQANMGHPAASGGESAAGTPNNAAGMSAAGASATGGSAGALGGAAGEPASAGTSGEGTVDAGMVIPEPEFDATALTIEGVAGPEMCRLSEDGRHLLVTVSNTGDVEIGATKVELRSTGTAHASIVRSPVLAAGASGEMQFDRGPVVGFVDNWNFELTIDPDDLHGGAHTPVTGSCRDLRHRASLVMPAMQAFYTQETGLYNVSDWWTSANQIETVIDYHRETGDPTYFDVIDNTFSKNSANDFDHFGYYDDDGWWGIVWVKAYDLTHDPKYLDMAKAIFARMTIGWTDNECDGGVYWASPKAGAVGNSSKNAIPNSLFMQLAAKLHLRTPGDTGPGSYLDWAEREWAWFQSTGMIDEDNLIIDSLDSLTECNPVGPKFTYNLGVLIGALVDLAEATGDATLLDQATAHASAGMTLMLAENGILRDPPCGGDICVQFKGVLMRNLRQLYRARPRAELLHFLRRHSDQLWNSDVRNDQYQFGWEWHLPFDNNPTAGRQSSALDALIAAIGAGDLNLALEATATASASCTADEGPEHAIDGGSRGMSKWCAPGASGQALRIDLGAVQTMTGFRLRHAGAGGENVAWNTRDFSIETSADGVEWTAAVAVTGNTENITDHPIPSVEARYARLLISTAQTAPDAVAARIYEFEILGPGLH